MAEEAVMINPPPRTSLAEEVARAKDRAPVNKEGSCRVYQLLKPERKITHANPHIQLTSTSLNEAASQHIEIKAIETKQASSQALF